MDIKELREMGYSYKAISEKLGISINTVKSYCRRNNLGEHNTPDNKCAMCGEILTNIPHKKKKRFCCDACRMKWWRENRHLLNRRTSTKLKCALCGKNFNAYINANRKYCSHECYIKARFGKCKMN